MDRVSYCYRFGTAEFDEARHELRVAGLPVDVERRVLAVLGYLLRHAGELVTKEELLREVWAGRITIDKVLPNAVAKLRRALGEANAGLIATQARVGYRLEGTVTRTAVGRQAGSVHALEPGQPVPGRANFELREQLARTGGSEVWLAEHGKTGERRVYKFAVDGDRLRALKREATLLRVLHDSVDDAGHFIDLIDWNFESAPYFLECAYGGEDLGRWAAGGLVALDDAGRLALFLQVADAVAAAHAVGVLHKDIKPANVLVADGRDGTVVRLTDFGSGHLLEPERLEQLGITRLGMTVEDGAAEGTSGTPLYLAPEVYAGHVPTVRSDVYALGILLYQVLAARVGQPLGSGWEQDIADPLLREDIRLATERDPARRLASAAELATRLRTLAARRDAAREREREADAARRDREALARSAARRPWVVAVVVVLAIATVVAVGFAREAVQARNAARAELARATAIARFLDEDLISRSNPLVSARGADASLREVLLAARERVGLRFGAQPADAAAIHASLASLFNTIELFAEAEAEARAALAAAETARGADSAAALQARAILVRVLARLGKLDEANAAMAPLAAREGRGVDALTDQRIAAARGALAIAQGDFQAAAAALEGALATLDPSDPRDTAQRDTLRLDLISVLPRAGRDADALRLGEAMIAELSARPGDPRLLVALAQLAMARAHGEDHAAIEALLRAAQPVIVERLGENHTRHLQLLGELLGVAFRRGDWPRAIEYAAAAQERLRAKFGDDHALTWVMTANRARALHEGGRAAEAVEHARAAHANLLRLAGPDSPQVHDARFLLAAIELDVGDTAAAEAHIATLDVDALERGRATGQWPAAIDVLRGIAAAQRGDAAAARAYLDAALPVLAAEEDLDAPSRVYVQALAARKGLPGP